MAAAEQRAKSAKMAADLVKRGIFHGKRLTSPAKDSGGMTMTFSPGSTKYKRLVASRQRTASN